VRKVVNHSPAAHTTEAALCGVPHSIENYVCVTPPIFAARVWPYEDYCELCALMAMVEGNTEKPGV